MKIHNLELLSKQDDKTLASWWSTLNRWECPEGLINCSIRNKDGAIIYGCDDVNVMNWIENKISFKECLRDWNKDRMNNEEFDAWWEDRHK